MNAVSRAYNKTAAAGGMAWVAKDEVMELASNWVGSLQLAHISGGVLRYRR
jgi:hypothetical protein